MKRATPYNVTVASIPAAPARGPRADGLSATAFPSGVRNVPVEITETLAPLVVWSKEYRQDSGGAGEHRGGLGQVMEIGSAEDMPFGISPTFDRVVFPARGRLGGQPGTTGAIELVVGQAPAAQGAFLDPGRRSPDRLDAGRRRLRRPAQAAGGEGRRGRGAAGWCRSKAARELYGVALTADGAVDEAETARLRTKVAAE